MSISRLVGGRIEYNDNLAEISSWGSAIGIVWSALNFTGDDLWRMRNLDPEKAILDSAKTVIKVRFPATSCYLLRTPAASTRPRTVKYLFPQPIYYAWIS
jgi:hypothetical protein